MKSMSKKQSVVAPRYLTELSPGEGGIVAATPTANERLAEIGLVKGEYVQLVKHAYGLKTQSVKRARGAVLVYLYAEPAEWASGKPVSPDAIARHRAEVADFARAVRGDDVTFVTLRWSDLLSQWSREPALFAHATALRGWFGAL